MNVHNMLSHDDTCTPMCKTWYMYAYVKEQDNLAQKQILGENINFDIKVKSQGHIEVMNACDTLSHSDTLICQIWYD